MATLVLSLQGCTEEPAPEMRNRDRQDRSRNQIDLFDFMSIIKGYEVYKALTGMASK